MELQLFTNVWGRDTDWHRAFYLLAVYAGKIQKRYTNRDFWWAEHEADYSILPIAHVMERAFKVNNLVIMKEPDRATQKLIKAHLEKEKLEIMIQINIGKGDSPIWHGSYTFDCKIEKMIPNQVDSHGRRWETALLKIKNRTERFQIPHPTKSLYRTF